MNKLLNLLTPRLLGLVFLVLPAALGTIYYGGFAANRYVSHTVIGVKDTAAGGGSAGGIASLLLGGSAPTSYGDTLYLENYFRSMDLMLRLEARLKLREHFSHAGADPLYRAWSWMSQEAFLDYFRNRVEIARDEFSGLITLDVQGFEPEFAQRLAQAMLEESEAFINEYSHRIARDKMRFAESEVERSRKSLDGVKQEVLAFQGRYKLLDPTSQAAAASSLTAGLQAKLAQQEAELKALQAIMQEDSFQVRTLKSQLAATQAQLEAERQRSTGGNVNGSQLPALTIQYQELLARAGFAEEAHKAALIAMESARVEASRKLKTLVVIEPPTRPQEARYPRRLYDLMTVLAIAAMFYTIVRLMVVTIREHQD